MPGLSGLFGGAGGGDGAGNALLKTGQTTQYNSEEDDGYHEKGTAKSYTVNTTGDYAGTSNIDLVHLTDTSIAFVNATSKITDSNNGLAMFKTGETIVVSGSSLNDGTYTIATGGVAGEIVVNESLTDESAGASVSIAKREAMSNNSVTDDNTGLMWMRYGSAENAVMGDGGDGQMPYNGQLYDIFQYAAAASAAAVGGHADWRVPNMFELISIMDMEAANALPDATAFPSWTTGIVHTSTSRPSLTTWNVRIQFSTGNIPAQGKTVDAFCALVRG